MFRRTPALPHPDAHLLDEGDAPTEVFDPVIASAGDTAVIPRVHASDPEDDIETSIIPAVHAGPPAPDETVLDAETLNRRRHREYQRRTRAVPPAHVTYAPPPERRSAPRPRRRPSRLSMPTIWVPRHPGSLESWRQAAREMARDPNSILGLIVLIVLAALTMWGTMVAFAPDWVPPVVNPRVDQPARTGSPLVPPVFADDPPAGPRKPLQRSQRPVPTPSKARVLPGSPEPSQSVLPSPSQTPSGTPTQEPDPGTPPTTGPAVPPSGPPSQDPGPTDPPTQGPTDPAEPSPPQDSPDPPTPSVSRSLSTVPTPPETSEPPPETPSAPEESAS